MKVSEARQIALAVKFALANAAKHGGSSSDRGLGMRYAAYDIANESWYTVIQPSKALARQFPDRDAWFKECGFKE